MPISTRAIVWVAIALAAAYSVFIKTPLGIPFGLAALAAFMWAGARETARKGYGGGLGAVLGVLNIFGLLYIASLREKPRPSASVPRRRRP